MVRLHDVGDTTLTGLGVHPDDGLVVAADILRVDGQVGDLPDGLLQLFPGDLGVVGTGLDLGGHRIQALVHRVLVGAGEGREDQFAAVGVTLRDTPREHFGRGLTDEDVHILDPFTGTGTFMVRLLQSGLISPEDLARKYASELHATEIMLLAYYVAAVNIETTYHALLGEKATREGTDTPEYEPFGGIALADTFQTYEDDDQLDLDVFTGNNDRIERQKQSPIHVIVGNPPYSVGQTSANDLNANVKYPTLDRRIEDTYAAKSTATNKNSLYDSYLRAFRWATDRIGDHGVVAFVSNGGWIDGNTADGVRLSLAEDYSDIYVFNLRGNQRTAGDQSRKE